LYLLHNDCSRTKQARNSSACSILASGYYIPPLEHRSMRTRWHSQPGPSVALPLSYADLSEILGLGLASALPGFGSARGRMKRITQPVTAGPAQVAGQSHHRPIVHRVRVRFGSTKAFQHESLAASRKIYARQSIFEAFRGRSLDRNRGPSIAPCRIARRTWSRSTSGGVSGCNGADAELGDWIWLRAVSTGAPRPLAAQQAATFCSRCAPF